MLPARRPSPRCSPAGSAGVGGGGGGGSGAVAGEGAAALGPFVSCVGLVVFCLSLDYRVFA